MRKFPLSESSEIPSLERGIAILSFLDHPFGVRGASASQLYRGLNLPRASLYRLLKPLLKARLVEQDAQTGRYRLGQGLIELGCYAWRSTPQTAKVSEVLAGLSNSMQQTSDLAVACGSWGIMWLDVCHVPFDASRTKMRPGLYSPLNHKNAHGLAFLAFDGLQRLREYLAKTARSETREELWLGPTQPPKNLEACCDEFRRRGYAWGRVTAFPHYIRVTAPVFTRTRPKRVTASLGLFLPVERPEIEKWGEAVMEKARLIERHWPAVRS